MVVVAIYSYQFLTNLLSSLLLCAIIYKTNFEALYDKNSYTMQQPSMGYKGR